MHAGRIELVAAALTILRGWIASGSASEASGELASFEECDLLVRQAVIWVGKIECGARGANAVGYDDPVANIVAQCAADDETEALGELLELWESVQGTKGFKAAELYSVLDSAPSGFIGATGIKVAVLGNSLRDAMPNARSSLTVSRWLRGIAGRIVQGRYIEGLDDKVANSKPAIHRWKPWLQNSGVKSAAGKAISKMNALKHGGRSAWVGRLSELLRTIQVTLEEK